MVIPGPSFSFFGSFQELAVNMFIIGKRNPMTGFKLQTSGIESDCSAN